tara:strand:+ start:190 stop:561 length:372 start_codon:yes stop_codon:yes gene_type:complete
MSNTIIDLDSKIPNYIGGIKKFFNSTNNDMQQNVGDYSGKMTTFSNDLSKISTQAKLDLDREVEQAKQIAGQYINNKWNELKNTFQQWSFGKEAEVTLGGGKKKTKKNKKKKKFMKRRRKTCK